MTGIHAHSVMDPYQCLAKSKRKYASECTEVYLTKKGAEALSEKFSHFTNLEIVWLTGNRLSHIENLESNIRIREVYVQDNRLVSLQGLRHLKFLTTLLVSSNQLRNLDKQLAVLSKFAFLRKLDLFDNPAAEEPDYRLRAIYALPQVEVLDRHSIKGLERIRAEEVVPNLDKVSAKRIEKPKRQPRQHSVMEQMCFREAAALQDNRRIDQEKGNLQFTIASATDPTAPLPEARAVGEHRKHWGNPRLQVIRERTRPTPWEEVEMRPLIKQRAGKDRLTKGEVDELTRGLAKDGIQEVGRKLIDLRPVGLAAPTHAQSSARLREASRSRTGKGLGLSASPLDELFKDPDTPLPIGEVTNWLLRLDWPRPDDQDLDRRVAQLNDEARRADFAGDTGTGAAKRMLALRLEGIKTREYGLPGLGVEDAVQEKLVQKAHRSQKG